MNSRNAYALLAAAGWLMAGTQAWSQVGVSARLDHTRTIRYEPVKVTVRVENRTSHALRLSSVDPAARIRFLVENAPGQPLPERPGAAELVLLAPAHGTGTVEADLLRLYDMRETGPYTIRAEVDWQGTSYSSPRMYLDVVPGLAIGEVVAEVGDPGAMRKLTLRTLNREQKEFLFLVIEDQSAGVCFGALDLGRIVRVQKPNVTVDGEGQVHILHQSGPRQYTHTVLTGDGEQVERELYAGDAGQVKLEGSPDGGVTVRGGRRAEPSLNTEPAPAPMPLPSDNSPVPAR